MKRVVVTLVLLLTAPVLIVSAEEAQSGPPNKPCEDLTLALGLPRPVGRLKAPLRVKCEDVDKMFAKLNERMQGHVCRLRFDQIFEVKQKKTEAVLFPITLRVIRTTPELSLKGLQVFNSEGTVIGVFESRVPREISGSGYAKIAYTIYALQYKNPEGEFVSTGAELLRDNYFLKWDDIKDKVALVSE
jgi:hypothetical protein